MMVIDVVTLGRTIPPVGIMKQQARPPRLVTSICWSLWTEASARGLNIVGACLVYFPEERFLSLGMVTYGAGRSVSELLRLRHRGKMAAALHTMVFSVYIFPAQSPSLDAHQKDSLKELCGGKASL